MMARESQGNREKDQKTSDSRVESRRAEESRGEPRRAGKSQGDQEPGIAGEIQGEPRKE